MANSTGSSSSGGGGGKTSSSSTEPDLKSDIDSLKADMAGLKDDLSHLVGSAVSEGKASLNKAKHNLEDKYESGAEAFEKCVSDHPIRSVAIAAGVGLVLGFLYRGR